MNQSELLKTAQAMMADDKGLLAMDESTPSCNKRFAALNIPQTEEMRRQYRELIVLTPGLGESISGAILYDETIRQKVADGRPMAKVLEQAGIIPGIKVDEGAKDLAGFAGEKVTEGLDGLRDRLQEYKTMGARFAKWRAVIEIGPGTPSEHAIHANAHALARYAALCQEADIVPIVEPEVLMDGSHTIEQCLSATERTLQVQFEHLYWMRIYLPGVILKPNMIVSGKQCPQQAGVEQVAATTVECFLRRVPAAVTGIAFLSGGQSPELASARLNAMNQKYMGRLPWALTFSYSRAIQQPALDLWNGKSENVAAAQRVLAHRARCNRAARRAEYTGAMETKAP